MEQGTATILVWLALRAATNKGDRLGVMRRQLARDPCEVVFEKERFGRVAHHVRRVRRWNLTPGEAGEDPRDAEALTVGSSPGNHVESPPLIRNPARRS